MKPPSTVYYVDFCGPNPKILGRVMSFCDALSKREEQTNLLSEGFTEERRSPPGRVMSGTYSCKDVAKLFDISEGRLRYWDRSGFLSPSGHDGKSRVYTFQDLIGIRSAKTLLDKGVSLQRARKLVESLRQKIPTSSHPVDRLRIMSDRNTVTVVEADREFEADSGQLLLDFNVGDFGKEVVAELPPKVPAMKDRTAYEWYLEGCRLDEDEATLSQAEEAYHKAIHMDPTLANAYTNLGNLMYRTGSVEDARALYQKAIEVDEGQPEAHYNLGFLEFESGLLESAEKCFTRAVKLDSDFADAHFNLAITLFRQDNRERARYHLQVYLKIEPTGPWADIARKRLEDMG